jgi:CRP-like cAMP-binding protein
MIPFSHLGPGKCFGELALQIDKLNPNKPSPKRAATIVCIENCKFATMSKDDY